MLLALISDLHMLIQNPKSRLDDLTSTEWAKLDFIMKFCSRKKIPLLQAGDLTDMPRSWYMVTKLARIFSWYFKVGVYSVFGQHDTYLYSDHTREATILGTLDSAGLVTVLSDKPVLLDSGNIAVYGCSFRGEVPAPVNPNGLNILVVHDHISNSSLFEGHKYTRATKYLKRNDAYKVILCGDIHKRFRIKIGGRWIVNSGPMLRTKASEHMLEHKPGFFLYNTERNTMVWKKIPHRPADEVLTRAHISKETKHVESLHQFLAELRNIQKKSRKSGNRPKFRENLELLLSKKDVSTEVKQALSDIMEGKIK